MAHFDSAAQYLAKAAELRNIFARDAVERDKQGERPLAQLRLIKQHHLLSVNIPAFHGGGGQPWSTLFRIVREFARADGATGQLFGYHALAQTMVLLRGSEQQAARLFHASATNDWTRAQRDSAAGVAIANVLAGETALDVTNRAFEGMGARSATTARSFDRFWRNVRTHTLHNPAEYKTRNVGQWFLTGEYPQPGCYR